MENNFVYTPGICLQRFCEDIATQGLFCDKHDPNKIINAKESPKTGTSLVHLPTILEMIRGASGFIPPWAVFEADEGLWVINNYLVQPVPDERNSTRIRRHKDGVFAIDKKTIDTNEIPHGWPSFTDPSEFSKVILK